MKCKENNLVLFDLLAQAKRAAGAKADTDNNNQ